MELNMKKDSENNEEKIKKLFKNENIKKELINSNILKNSILFTSR